MADDAALKKNKLQINRTKWMNYTDNVEHNKPNAKEYAQYNSVDVKFNYRTK